MGYELFCSSEPVELPMAPEIEEALACFDEALIEEAPQGGPGDAESCFYASNVFMAALRWEMNRQGMLTLIAPPPNTDPTMTPDRLGFHPGPDTGLGGIPAYKLSSNDGWVVTSAEIAGALRIASARPAPPDHESHEPTEEVLHSLGFEVVSPGRNALLTMPINSWEAEWNQWLRFMRLAAGRGGFIVL